MAKPRAPRTKIHGMILYPDNEDMMGLWRYLIDVFPCVWIKHDAENPPKTISCTDWEFMKSISELPDPVKEHWHLMCKFDEPMTASGVVNFSGGVLSHVEPITAPKAMARYFVHQDPKSIRSGKKMYLPSDVRTNSPAWFHTLYAGNLGVDDDTLDMYIIKTATECSSFAELAMRLGQNNIDALHYFRGHIQYYRLLFPHFPQNLSDCNKIASFQNVSSEI